MTSARRAARKAGVRARLYFSRLYRQKHRLLDIVGVADVPRGVISWHVRGTHPGAKPRGLTLEELLVRPPEDDDDAGYDEDGDP